MRMAVAAVMAHALVACAGSPATKRATTQLPLLELPLIAGGMWSSANARGSVLVIDVWASWCRPCSKGFPKLNALAASDPTITVVAISIDEDPAAIRAFLAQFPLTVPVAHDVNRALMTAPLRIAQLPVVLVVDRAGVVRHRLEEPTEHDYDKLGELVADSRR